jgi:hypothetical protein
MFNCTISENLGSRGAGIWGTAYLNHCTVVSNEVYYPGYEGDGVEGDVRAQNCIFGGNVSNDISGVLTSDGYNLIQNTNGCRIVGDQTGNIYGSDPLLGPLQDNGGPTRTHALLPGSPAIDAGSSGGLTTDQRGVPRPYDVPGVPNVADGSDIGAFEWTPSLDSISAAVERLVSEVSQSGVAKPRPLMATLQAALASIERGDASTAANQLQAFQNQVSAQLAPSNPGLVQALILEAQAITEALRYGFAPKVHSVKRQPDGKVQLSISALALQAPVVEASTDLVNWQVIGVATDRANGLFEFEDASAAKFSSRFYRIK